MFIRSRCLLLLACRLAAVAATPQGGGQWSEIPADELAIKDDPFNPGAKAIVLYHEVSNDDVRQLESHHYRIKVLTDEGRSLGDVQIPYAEKISSVGDIRARVVQPDGRTVDFNGQVFDKLVVKARKVQVQEKTFTLPEVRSGSIIEYVYATHWQQKAPDVLRHPGNYLITSTQSLPITHWIIPHELFIHRARFTLRPLPYVKVVWTAVLVNREKGPVQQPDGSFVMQVENVAGYPEEKFAPPENMMKPCVDFFYVVGFLQDARDFWSSYIRLRVEEIEPFWRESKAVRQIVNETISDNDPPETKLRKLYDRTQQAHERAFAYFGGVFRKLRYDNLGAAVKKILRGHRREETARFVAFRSHWRFEAEFCTPAQAHEKGGVEGEAGYFRRNHWVPVPEADDLAALNRQLLNACQEDEHRRIAGRDQTVGASLLIERDHLLPLVEGFDLAQVSFPTVNGFGCAKVLTNTYSVPLAAGVQVQAKVSSSARVAYS